MPLKTCLGWNDETSKIFNRYIVLTQIEPTAYSNYAMAHELTDKHLGTGGRPLFIEESFAEDFRLFWLKPEALSSRKLAVFKDLCNLAYPDIDRFLVRKKIRSTLGNYYGKSVDDSLVFGELGPPHEFAAHLDRRKAEDKRDRAKKNDF